RLSGEDGLEIGIAVEYETGMADPAGLGVDQLRADQSDFGVLKRSRQFPSPGPIRDVDTFVEEDQRIPAACLHGAVKPFRQRLRKRAGKYVNTRIAGGGRFVRRDSYFQNI